MTDSDDDSVLGAIVLVVIFIVFVLAAMPDEEGCRMVPTNDGYAVEVCP